MNAPISQDAFVHAAAPGGVVAELDAFADRIEASAADRTSSTGIVLAGTDATAIADTDTSALPAIAADAREIQAVLRKFGYESTTLDYLVSDVRARIARSSEDMLQIGRAVLCFRELPRGGYSKAIRAAGLTEDTARRVALVASKFLGADARRPILQLDRSKIYELALLDNDQIDEIAGDPAQLDQIDRMPVSELRRKLREARRETAAKQTVISTLGEENASLREAAARAAAGPARDTGPEQAMAQREARIRQVEVAAEDLRTAAMGYCAAIQASIDAGDPSEIELTTKSAAFVASMLAEAYRKAHIDVDLDYYMAPDWAQAAD